MEEYIKKLLEQVRFKKAHKSIEGEIRSHIEEQINDNISAGMDRADAEKAAVEDMGDPVEVGISMDGVHRPQIAWNVVALAVIIGIMSIFVHEFMIKDAAINDAAVSVVGSYIFYTKVLAGLVAMIIVYLIDYTVIAKYAKVIAMAMLIILLLGKLGLTFHGMHMYLQIGPFYFLTSAFMLLYIPLYGAIVYKYRGGGILDYFKALIWLLIPALFVIRWPRFMTAMVLIMTMVLQLTIAVAKGWFKIPKIPVIVAMWSAITIIPVGIVYFLYSNRLLADYQMDRIRAFLYLDNDASYITKTVRSFTDVALTGNTGKELLGALPNPNSDFLLLYLSNKYGLLLVAIIVAAVSSVIIIGCMASVKSKNQLGLVMGAGCMNVLLVNMLINVLENLGVIPFADSFMPFFSAGGSNIVLAYIFLGIILSIYKYKDAYPQHLDIGIRVKLKNLEL